MGSCAILIPLLSAALELRVSFASGKKDLPLWSDWGSLLKEAEEQGELPKSKAVEWYLKLIDGDLKGGETLNIPGMSESSRRLHERILGAGLTSQVKKIPRIIWQTAPDTCDPSAIVLGTRSWQSVNFQLWSHRLASDAAVAALVDAGPAAAKFPTLPAIVQALPLGVMRSDVWRYLVLYEYGGVYADLDTVCLRPADVWVPPDCRLLIGPETPHPKTQRSDYFAQFALAAEKGHPALERVLELVMERVESDGGINVTRRGEDGFVHYYTGPAVWTRAVIETISRGDPAAPKCDDAQCVFNNRRKFKKLKELGICLNDVGFFNSVNVAHKSKEPFLKLLDCPNCQDSGMVEAHASVLKAMRMDVEAKKAQPWTNESPYQHWSRRMRDTHPLGQLGHFRRMSIFAESAENSTEEKPPTLLHAANSTWQLLPSTSAEHMQLLPSGHNMSDRFEKSAKRAIECNLLSNPTSVWQRFLQRNSFASWQQKRTTIARFYALPGLSPP